MPGRMIYDVIIPAGGKISPEFAARVGTEAKALIMIHGESVLERTIRAVQDSGVARNIVVIGGPEVRAQAESLGVATIPEGDTGPENLFKGLDVLCERHEAPSKVLVLSCDLPFLSPSLIQSFVNSCPADRDVCIPLIDESAFRQRFPGTDATFVALKDNVWTTGCIFLLDVQAMRQARVHIEKVFENRKSKLGMARLLGPGFVIKWLMKSLSLSDVEKKIENLLGCKGKAVVNSAPEFAFDIDYVEDFEYAVANAGQLMATL
jgi:GTP:adenosylcobinamide-phosphate guanylyltransferase